MSRPATRSLTSLRKTELLKTRRQAFEKRFLNRQLELPFARTAIGGIGRLRGMAEALETDDDAFGIDVTRPAELACRFNGKARRGTQDLFTIGRGLRLWSLPSPVVRRRGLRSRPPCWFEERQGALLAEL